MSSALSKAWASIQRAVSPRVWTGVAFVAIGLPLALSSQVAAQSPNNWLHFHKDEQITGWNPNETILTPDVVANGNFGIVWESDPDQCGGADSHMYASPLYVEGLTMATGDQYDGMTFGTLPARDTPLGLPTRRPLGFSRSAAGQHRQGNLWHAGDRSRFNPAASLRGRRHGHLRSSGALPKTPRLRNRHHPRQRPRRLAAHFRQHHDWR